MLSRPLLGIATVAALALGLAGCQSGSPTATRTPSPSSTTGPTTSASPTSDVESPAPPQPPVPAGPRTAAQLKASLLVLDDLPSGFSLEPAAGDGGVSASSRAAGCEALVKLSNAKTAPGSKGSANVSFSGGQEGPFIDESVDAMGSAQAVAALQKSLAAAVASCQHLVITIPGQGTSTMKVITVSAPKFGDHALSARMTAEDGPLDGLTITQVTTGVNDVIVSLTLVAASPEDVDGATEAAVSKAQEILGVEAPAA